MKQDKNNQQIMNYTMNLDKKQTNLIINLKS